jgi:2-keto-4-pentenoate hydratase/2-oxohepta-3-ene-1,7-dioic acid hydratase in catechol pathway
MRILRYRHAGSDRTGLLLGANVVDVSSRAPELDDLRVAVSATGRQRLLELAVADPDAALDEVQLLAPVHPEARIFCVGRNFRDHVAEGGTDSEPPEPRIFLRTHQSLVGPGGHLEMPSSSETFDYEGEVAVVIGEEGRFVPAIDAPSYVAAYTCFNDGSVREFQRHTTTAGKNFDRSGAIGPWLVTSDEVGSPDLLGLTTRINGQIVQQAHVNGMIYPIPEVISYLSVITTLLPGDVISMGTPSGVGNSRNPPRFLRDGDRVDIEVSGVGILSVVVA